jgi:hypothetical protein
MGCAPSFHPLTTQLTPKPKLHPMLCLVLPGGILWWVRVRYTARRKLALLMMAKRVQDKAHSKLEIEGEEAIMR